MPKRILLLTSHPPYPVRDGEDLRIYNLVKHLKERNEIHLVTYRRDHAIDPEMTELFQQTHLLDGGPGAQSNVCDLYQKVVEALTPSRIHVFDERVSALLRSVLARESFDLIWIPAWQMMHYCLDLPLNRVVLDVMDDGVLELFREARHSQSPKQLVVNLKRLFQTVCFERKYFPRVRCCILVTEHDARMLKRVCPGANAIIISNGVDTEYFSPLGLPEAYPSLIFEGNMSFGPSVDGIRYFHSEILPLIRHEIPATKLWIVGKDPVPAILDLRSENVLVTGYVDDVRPYLDQASVFVCPMRKGAGIKNKLLQAWAMGKAIVATPIALAGLKAEPGTNIVVGKDARQFATAVVRLLQDRSKRESLGDRGRKTVLDLHNWKDRAESFETLMESI
jgi:polysaccharide biosynthesis protein PslH